MPEANAQGTVTAASVGFGTYSGQTDAAANTLFCGLGVNTNLGLNHTGVMASSGYKLGLSVDANFGGIGTGITFTNQSNQASANILQTASGTGAGWQTSYFIYDQFGDRLIVFNQAAGNGAGFQWGLANAVSNLTETAWSPLWSDHYHPTYSKTGFATAVGTTPCTPPAFQFDDGRGSFVATPIETPYGNATHVTNAYQLRSNYNQYWGFIGVDQSMYLNGVVAVQSNLQIVLVGKSGWVEGPINPTGTFALTHAVGSCSGSGCSYQTASDVAYILLSYTIGGQNYEVVILEPDTRATIIQTFTPYCSVGDDAGSCGAVQIHSFLTSNDPVQIALGQIRTYQMEYYIGTPSQLSALGFDTVEGASVKAYTPGRGTVCAANRWAGTNNQYYVDPVSNLVSNSGSGFYSSMPFVGDVNDNGTYATVDASTYGAGHLQLSARVAAGNVYGFPSLYKLSTTTTDGSATVDLGVYNTQPDSTGTVDIPLGYKIDMNNLMIVPVVLGQDNYENYYLQLAGSQMCN